MVITAHCDGGSRGNPGPSGFGAVLESEKGESIARLSQYLGNQTNNFAEYSGLIAVLEYAVNSRITHLKVVSDSQVMVRQMQHAYKVNSPSLKPLWCKAQELSTKLTRFEIEHTLRAGNKDADELANQAMDRGHGAIAEATPQVHWNAAAVPVAGPKRDLPAGDKVGGNVESIDDQWDRDDALLYGEEDFVESLVPAQPSPKTVFEVVESLEYRIITSERELIATTPSKEWADKMVVALNLSSLPQHELTKLQGF
jgi:ribonuclease HI